MRDLRDGALFEFLPSRFTECQRAKLRLGMPAVLVIILGILVIGTIAAVWWWNISAKASPYADEAMRLRSKSEEARKAEEEATVVINDFAKDSARNRGR